MSQKVKILFQGKVFGPIHAKSVNRSEILLALTDGKAKPDDYTIKRLPYQEKAYAEVIETMNDVLVSGLYEILPKDIKREGLDQRKQHEPKSRLETKLELIRNWPTNDETVSESEGIQTKLTEITDQLEELHIRHKYNIRTKDGHKQLQRYARELDNIIKLLKSDENLRNQFEITAVALKTQLDHIIMEPVYERKPNPFFKPHDHEQQAHLCRIRNLQEKLYRIELSGNSPAYRPQLQATTIASTKNSSSEDFKVQARRDMRIRVIDSMTLTGKFKDDDIKEIVETIIPLEEKRLASGKGISKCHGKATAYPSDFVRLKIQQDFNL
jgi:hypothetical protein